MYTTVLLPLACLCSLTFAQVNNIARIGNDIRNSTSGIEWQGTTFLLNGDPFYQPEGVLFAFAAWFRNSRPMKFQVWRPENVALDEYHLVAEWEITPTVPRGREDIYLYQTQCMYFQKEDRIGIYTPEVPGSVAYSFNSSTPQALQHISDPNNPTQTGEAVTFGGLSYPYQFSAAAYIDTDIAKYSDLSNPECPKQKLIPRDTAFPRNIPGATGATGPQGVPGTNGAVGATGPVGAPGLSGRDGSAGSPGPQGNKGERGDRGEKGPVGATGAEGPKGEKGDEGQQGATGPAGPVGPMGPMEVSEIDDEVGDCEWCWKLLNPYLILGILIWLIVVTVILLIMCICSCCRRDNNAAKQPIHYHSNTVTGWNHKDLWKTNYEDVETSSKPGYENPSMDNSYYVEEEYPTKRHEFYTELEEVSTTHSYS